MIDFCEFLPEIIPCENPTYIIDYLDMIYLIFKKNYLDKPLYYSGLKVQMRYHPKECEREQVFYHLTHRDYHRSDVREPDLDRTERILWIRYILTNWDCSINSCNDCVGYKIWDERIRSKTRRYFFLEIERYVVIMEKRDKYWLLITAYYIDQDYTFKDFMRRYNRSSTKIR